MRQFDIAIIGAGPAGYVAAIRARQQGFSTVCIEKRKELGGTCLNVGCIPSKALLHSTELLHQLEKAAEHGIMINKMDIDLSQMMKRKEKIVDSLTNGIDYLFKKNQVERLFGTASFLSPTELEVTGKNQEVICAKSFVLATGSEAIALPFLPFDEKVVLSSTGALSLQAIPEKMLIIGAGIIGLELGSVYQRLGSKIEVVELLDRPVATMDGAISKEIAKIFKKQGMVFYFSTKVLDAEIGNNSVSLFVQEENGKKLTLTANCVLVAVGRRAYHEGLGLDRAGVNLDAQGRILINHAFQTSQPSIYAVGDVVDGPMLAHKASDEAIALIDMLAGKSSSINYLAIPNVMYTSPEVATVGMTEEEALAEGLAIICGTSPFSANSRAKCTGAPDGVVKIIGEKTTDRLIGMHIIGPNASEMIGEAVIAIEKKITVGELALSPHAHPTCSEAIKEAALACHNQAIHS